ncbi:alpha/beta fold hydrolase [Chryseotalea sanaruensis]|uniref:Alpha/beta fold hydrolase n=1 Tax=Chryseotalea sanaruensis TaxID=2482724 RepID=A0A401UBR1_9BACT|nr:alpha/beta fold hydrolase [Chryseotalea sanaruensis]GCC52343.1 alpha/beta fold hydrolase [Chryseotalea sanaruensis]
MERIEIRQNVDHTLCGYWVTSSHNDLKGTILVCPAMGISAKFYINMSSWIAEQGYAILILDYRGVGLSAPATLKNFSADLNDWVADMEIAAGWLKHQHPQLPCIFLGHSIGGQLFGFINNKDLFSNAVFIATSTGYWFETKNRWKNFLLLKTIMPLSVFIWGFINAKFFKQGDNYPTGAGMQWRKWCMSPSYFGTETFRDTSNFYSFDKKITSIWFTDDPIANAKNVPKLLSFYKQAFTQSIQLIPSQFNLSKIGHTSFLSKRMKDKVWPVIVKHLD